VAQAPEHVIENLKLAEKSARDGKKTVKRQPPEKKFRQLGQKHLCPSDRGTAREAHIPLFKSRTACC